MTTDRGDLDLFESLESGVRALSETPPRGLLVNARGRVVSAGVDVHTVTAVEVLPCPTVFAAPVRLTVICPASAAGTGSAAGLTLIVNSRSPVPDIGDTVSHGWLLLTDQLTAATTEWEKAAARLAEMEKA